jgi:hypothetical protein
MVSRSCPLGSLEKEVIALSSGFMGQGNGRGAESGSRLRRSIPVEDEGAMINLYAVFLAGSTR